MFKVTRCPLVFSAALFCNAAFAGTDNTITDQGWIDSITLGFGYSRAISSLKESNGGVPSVTDPAIDGRGFAATLVFDYEVLPRLSPYIDLANLIQDDRDFLIPSLGLRYQFESEDGLIQPFLAVGAGYVYTEWNEAPVPAVNTSEPSGQSFGGSLQAGVDIFIAENLAFNFTARYDMYDIGTTIIENSRLTTIEDRASLSALVGLTYRFGKKRLKDDDGDGVPNLRDECPNTIRGAPVDGRGCALDSDADGVIDLYDRCPDTLPHLPVSECGCPPWKFEFNLELEFDRFRIADLKNRPAFDPIAFLKKHPHYHIRITGHTDNVGSAKYNLALSKWRANAARDLLVEKGIAEQRIHTKGRGAEDPLVANLTPEQRAKNRRIFVEIYRADMVLTTDIIPMPAKTESPDTEKNEVNKDKTEAAQ